MIVVEDDGEIRELLRRILSDDSSIHFIKTYPNGDAFLNDFIGEAVDVVVMDINMPHINGIDATIEIKSRHPEVAVIGLSVQNSGETREAMLRAGAATLISKEAAVDELYLAIRQALAGEKAAAALPADR